jgi:hypothetical protein
MTTFAITFFTILGVSVSAALLVAWKLITDDNDDTPFPL